MDRTGERSEQDIFIAGGVRVRVFSEVAKDTDGPVFRIGVVVLSPVRAEFTGIDQDTARVPGSDEKD